MTNNKPDRFNKKRKTLADDLKQLQQDAMKSVQEIASKTNDSKELNSSNGNTNGSQELNDGNSNKTAPNGSNTKKKKERIGFSFKLDNEDAERLITYHMETGEKLSDFIENSLIKALKKEKVEVIPELVEEYYQRKEEKKRKAEEKKKAIEENKAMKAKIEELEKQLAEKKSISN